MKKSLILVLCCILMLGVSGCMLEKNTVSKENNSINEGKVTDDEQTIQDMLNYANTMYNQDFELVEFYPSQKGFNTGASSSYLLAKNDEGEHIIISGRNDMQGLYYVNYDNVKYSKILKEELEKMKDFEGELFVYVQSLELQGKSREEMRKLVMGIAKNAHHIIVRVALPSKVDQVDLTKAHAFYNKLIEINPSSTFEIVGPTNPELTKDYFNYFDFYDRKYWWYEFDTSIKQVLNVSTGKPITYEEFTQRIEEVN